MESDMTRLVAENQSAHASYSHILGVAAQDTIVCSAHQFGERQNLQFKTDAQVAAAPAKSRVAPMRFYSATAKTIDRQAQQT